MTYCVGMLLDRGLVLMSDTRTNAGVDNISTFRKMFHWEVPGERIIAVMTAGNLPDSTPYKDHPIAWEAHGGSSIVAPGAVYVTEPVFDVETIVTGTIDVQIGRAHV